MHEKSGERFGPSDGNVFQEVESTSANLGRLDYTVFKKRYEEHQRCKCPIRLDEGAFVSGHKMLFSKPKSRLESIPRAMQNSLDDLYLHLAFPCFMFVHVSSIRGYGIFLRLKILSLFPRYDVQSAFKTMHGVNQRRKRSAGASGFLFVLCALSIAVVCVVQRRCLFSFFFFQFVLFYAVRLGTTAILLPSSLRWCCTVA